MKHLTKTVLILPVLLLVNCSSKKSEVVWNQNLSIIGSQSSPRACDLNNDGILDIVMGAGKNEFQFSDKGIIALDGKTGMELWHQEATDQVYGSATFLDVNADGTKDVFIGGRSPHFKALNGKNGEVLWQYKYEEHTNDSILQYARYNFNNSVLVPDQNDDGQPELLTTNGGNSTAIPSSEKNRYPGVLLVFDSKTGSIIAADTMPDGKETYMSPVSFQQPGRENETLLVFGTGGETISGNLYVAKLSDLMDHKLVNAKVIASESGHGFIAPPSIADLNGDGLYDIVAISHKSTVVAVSGKSYEKIWERKINNTESSNSMAVGFFTSDDAPDLFTFVSKGEWPNSAGSVQVMLNGKTGSVEFMDSIGCTGFSSPVIYDLNNDGQDEAIISINKYDCAGGFTDPVIKSIENNLMAVDFKNNRTYAIDEAKGFKNIFSTPWIGDLDNDGYLDIVNCRYYSSGGLLTFLGMNIKRIETSVKVNRPILWGSYMGANGDGIFQGIAK